ncbi:ABC transporter substrate-binding protein [Desulfosporosinus sp. FKB]|uniref:ABC transporter substrate-binding protein n=1 Tax=Desulfosporosinus sp. FKB TaxID=1969835 RepID=UPI000B49D5F1|nr:ABC transporter substrate-binding protein [Desulfosporosinus sp. FKB]
MKKFFVMATAAVLSLSLLAGCGTTGATSNGGGSSAGGNLKIGADLELTGGVAMFGTAAQKAIDLAVEQQNANGGLLGKQIKMDYADNKSDPGESTNAATKLITQDSVVAVIGAMTSGNTLAASQVAIDNKVPLISPTGTADKVTVENGQVKPYIFRACFIDPFQGQVAAQFAANTLKVQKAAIFIDQKSDYSIGLANAFSTNFKSANGQIVSQEKYVAGDKDFRPQLARIKSSNPDVVFVPGYYGEVGPIVKQAREMGMNQAFIGGDGWGSPELFNLASADQLNNCYYVNHVAIDDPSMADFVKAFKAKYNQDPDSFAALGYDAARLMFQAIKDANSTNGDKIRTALENLKGFKGLNGDITMDPKTHNPIKDAVIIKIENGKNVFMTKVSPK